MRNVSASLLFFAVFLCFAQSSSSQSAPIPDISEENLRSFIPKWQPGAGLAAVGDLLKTKGGAVVGAAGAAGAAIPVLGASVAGAAGALLPNPATIAAASEFVSQHPLLQAKAAVFNPANLAGLAGAGADLLGLGVAAGATATQAAAALGAGGALAATALKAKADAIERLLTQISDTQIELAAEVAKVSKDAAIAAALAPLNKVAAGIKLCIAIQKQYVEPAIKACIGLITGLASPVAGLPALIKKVGIPLAAMVSNPFAVNQALAKGMVAVVTPLIKACIAATNSALATLAQLGVGAGLGLQAKGAAINGAAGLAAAASGVLGAKVGGLAAQIIGVAKPVVDFLVSTKKGFATMHSLFGMSPPGLFNGPFGSIANGILGVWMTPLAGLPRLPGPFGLGLFRDAVDSGIAVPSPAGL